MKISDAEIAEILSLPPIQTLTIFGECAVYRRRGRLYEYLVVHWKDDDFWLAPDGPIPVALKPLGLGKLSRGLEVLARTFENTLLRTMRLSVKNMCLHDDHLYWDKETDRHTHFYCFAAEFHTWHTPPSEIAVFAEKPQWLTLAQLRTGDIPLIRDSFEQIERLDTELRSGQVTGKVIRYTNLR